MCFLDKILNFETYFLTVPDLFLQITLAQNFQEMYLKIILDRTEFIPQFVPLGKNAICKSSSSTFYLLLPVILHDNESTITVDWEIVMRCLSSPVFRTSGDAMVKEHFPLDVDLQLINGCRSISDVENSLVYAPHRKEFFFISNIVHGKNGYSPYKESETSSYLEHLEQYVTRLFDTWLTIYIFM